MKLIRLARTFVKTCVIFIIITSYLNYKLQPPPMLLVMNKLRERVDSGGLEKTLASSHLGYESTRWHIVDGKIQMILIFKEEVRIPDEILIQLRAICSKTTTVKLAKAANSRIAQIDNPRLAGETDFEVWMSLSDQ